MGPTGYSVENESSGGADSVATPFGLLISKLWSTGSPPTAKLETSESAASDFIFDCVPRCLILKFY